MLKLGVRATRETDLWSSLDLKARLTAPEAAELTVTDAVEAHDASRADATSAAAGGGGAGAKAPAWMHSVNGRVAAYDPVSAKPDSGPPAGAGTGTNASGPGLTALLAQYFDAGDSRYEFSGNQLIDATLIGSKWTLATVNFSFPTDGSQYGGVYYDAGYLTNHVDFNAAQQTAARYAFTLVENYTLLNLDEITETASVHGHIRLSQTSDASLGSAEGNFPSSQYYGGDIWFGMTGQPFYLTPAPGNWGQATIMHEIGHTLGLKHGHQDYEFTDLAADQPGAYGSYLDGPSPRFGSAALPSGNDGQAWSLMTYRPDPASGIVFQGDGINQPQTYMQADIAALQYMYGADFNYLSGATTYTFNAATGEMSINGVGQGAPSGNKVLRTIWDGNGVDTYDFSNYTGNQSINLTPGAFSTFSTTQLADHRPLGGGPAPAPGNIANALLYNGDSRSYIENAVTGSGNDTIVGNNVSNALTGNGGADSIFGGSLFDTLNGGAGNDLLEGGFDGDTLNGGADNDTLFAMTQAAPAASAVGDQLNGDAGNDTITGSNGNDTINGGDHTDRMLGGNGNDIISQSFGGPNETMDGGAGNDTGDWTYSNANWTIDLAAGTANIGATTFAVLTSLETVLGGGGNDSIDGSDGADSLNGGVGDDLLDGGRGYNDTLNGSSGTDTADYSWIGPGFESANIVLSLAAQSYADNFGTETWISIENVIGTQSGETLIGNVFLNAIDGQGGNDTIRGGDGYDFLNGGAGIDTLDYATDFPSLPTATIDLIAGTYFDGFFTETVLNFENVIATGGSQTILGTNGANRLEGRGSNDTLDGRDGDDTLLGGDGDDTLIQGFAFGLEVLDGGAGVDTGDWSFSNDNWTISLAAGTAFLGATQFAALTSIENVVGGNGNEEIIGSAGVNALDGGEGDDTINDGIGDDAVTGGGGNDTFQVGDSILGLDTWNGGLGFDIWDASAYLFSDGVTIDLGGGFWDFFGFQESITNTEGARDSQGNGTVLGSADANLLDGQNGDDTLRGFAGADTILGGLGADYLQGGADGDSIDGGDGVDTLDYSDGPAVTVSLANVGFQNTGGSGVDKITGVENLIGTAGADILGGDGANNRIHGNNQSDTLTGSGGDDTLIGGQGGDSVTGGAANDIIWGGFGPDTMVGGLGIYTLDYSMLAGETFLDISISVAQNTHSGGNDTLIGFENVTTGGGDDRVFGSGQVNLIRTGGGADTVKAADGADQIVTEAGDDRVNGGGGGDTVTCGLGRDFMRGGIAADTFDFNSNAESGVGVGVCDIVRDFRTAQGDKIDLQDVIAGSFTYLGASGFTGTTAEVRVIVVAGGQLIQIDSDVDGLSDMEILVANSGLAGGAADFVL